METAAASSSSVGATIQRGRSVVSGATVRYKKDGSVAKKIGRPPKKASSTINTLNSRNNNNNNNYKINSSNIQRDNNAITINSRANYGYRSIVDNNNNNVNNNNNNNTIIAPNSMNVSTVSDPVEELLSSRWTSPSWKRSNNFIDSRNSKYTKM
jgi:hypothetical protein